MNSDGSFIKPDEAFDDGVVCFGPVSKSEIERSKRLPRYTVVPSDLILSHSYFDETVRDGNNAKNKTLNENNDVSISNYSDESKDSTAVQVDDSIDTTRSTVTFDDKENKVNSFELIQSTSKYSPSSFTSPCASQFAPSDNLIATEVLNRYIRMETTFSDESSMEQDVSAFEDENVTSVDGKEEDEELSQGDIVCENVGFIDVQKAEVTHDDSINSEVTSPGKLLSVSSVIEQSNYDNENNVSDAVNNVCLLKYRSQEEENDESICSNSELRDAFEDDSIVPDKYSITPGKQRLFDVRNTKRSFYVKSNVFMDKIEESTTPIIPKPLIPQSILNDDSFNSSEIENKIDGSLSKSIDFSSSAVNTSCVKDTISNNSSINVTSNTKKSIIMDMEVKTPGSSNNESMHENNLCNELACTNSFSVENTTVDSNMSFNVIDNCSEPSNVMRRYIDFNQTQIEDDRNVSSADINLTLSESKNYCDQSSVSIIEQTNCSEVADIKKNDESLSVSKNCNISIIEQTNCSEVADIKKNDESLSVPKHCNISIIEQNICSETTDTKKNDESLSVSKNCNISIVEQNMCSETTDIKKNDESLSVSKNCNNSIIEQNICSETTDIKKNDESLSVSKNCNNSIIEQTNCSETTDLKEIDESFSVPENLLIIEQTICSETTDKKKNDESLSVSKNCNISIIEQTNCSETTDLKEIDESFSVPENLSIIEQTICSEMAASSKNDESYSFLDDLLKPKLSIIIENKTLEEEEIVQVKDQKSVVNDVFNNLVSNNILNDTTDNQTLNKSKEASNIAEDVLKSHVVELPTMNVTSPLEKEINKNENNSTDQSIISSVMSLNENEDTFSNITLDSCFLLENSKISEIESKIMSEVENKLGNITNEQILSQSIESNDWNVNNLTDISVLNTSELILKSKRALQSLNNQEHLLNTTDQMSQSLAEFNKIEQLLFEEDNKEFEFKTPKTQKLLDVSTVQKPSFLDSRGTQQMMDFSIVQQSPFLENQSKKQKLINFSIVDQSPMFNKTIPQNHNSTKADNLMDFSSINQMNEMDAGVVPANEIDFQKTSFKSLLTISPPNVELFADESIKTNLSSDRSDLSLDQTITDNNFKEPNSNTNVPNMEDMVQFSDKNNLAVSVNEQIKINESLNSLNTTISQNKSCNEQSVRKSISKSFEHGSELIFDTSNIGSVMDSNQQVTNKYGIQDFSIVEQLSKPKNIENITPAESTHDVSNLIEMSVANTLSNERSFLSHIPILTVSSQEESEKTLNSSSSEDANNTAIHFEESQLGQKESSDVSHIVESPDKSSVGESFHSIESNHNAQEDKKRKMESMEENHTEKKAKVNAEELSTPTSMLYKIRNMFRSSEKPLHFSSSNTKENDLKSSVPRQRLDLSHSSENRANISKSLNFKKSEVVAKSKIPCKITDVSMTKNEGSNVSSSLNDHNVVKPKKTIPKFTGLPVLSDVSNSSSKKCPESHTPSRFLK